MFIEVFIFSIVLGFILKGNIKNFDVSKIKSTYLVFIAFSIEFIIVILIRNHVVARGTLTYIFDLLMYLILFLFIYLNRQNKYLVLMGIGFLLNALPIFLNGGAMPVDAKATVIAGLFPSIEEAKISSEGLYTIINSNTKLWFLGDIFPKTILRNYVFSIGDVVLCIGLMLFIVSEMTRNHAER